jgi:hypothetical protein
MSIQGLASCSMRSSVLMPDCRQPWQDIPGEGVFSLWLVISNVIVDVGLWVANPES